MADIDMTVGTSYTAVGEALSAGSADIGFISGGNYVLFSDDCDVLLTALRYAINKDCLLYTSFRVTATMMDSFAKPIEVNAIWQAI